MLADGKDRRTAVHSWGSVGQALHRNPPCAASTPPQEPLREVRCPLLQTSGVWLRESAKLVRGFANPGTRGCRQTTLSTNSSGRRGGPHMACALRKALHWLTRSIPTRTLHVILVWGRSWCAGFGREVCNWCRVAKSKERSCWVIPHFHFSTTLCGFTNLRHRSTNYWALTVYIRGVAWRVPFYPYRRT